jgi:hypothetical protein
VPTAGGQVDSCPVEQPTTATGLDTVRRRRWVAVPAEGQEAVTASLAAAVSHFIAIQPLRIFACRVQVKSSQSG